MFVPLPSFWSYDDNDPPPHPSYPIGIIYISAHIEVMSGPTYLIYFRIYDMSKALNRDSGNAILKTQDKIA